ncbi:unnamed protein product [Lathyrus sativus]|nr:unnamed protein product [Lathyrus sativus]
MGSHMSRKRVEVNANTYRSSSDATSTTILTRARYSPGKRLIGDFVSTPEQCASWIMYIETVITLGRSNLLVDMIQNIDQQKYKGLQSISSEDPNSTTSIRGEIPGLACCD